MNRGVLCIVLGLLVIPAAAEAQQCSQQATVGNFEVQVLAPMFDGTNTDFTYCITGLDDPALSNWSLSLDAECLSEFDISGCAPDPCFLQIDDPNTGITGIKFDDVEVEPGETECFTLSLVGDWTSQVGESTLGLKAGHETAFGQICGPICQLCGATLEVLVGTGSEPTLSTSVFHNRPRAVTTDVLYEVFQLFAGSRELIHSWTDGPVTLQLGSEYEFFGPMPDLPPLGPGRYMVKITMEGMNGWASRIARFVIE